MPALRWFLRFRQMTSLFGGLFSAGAVAARQWGANKKRAANLRGDPLISSAASLQAPTGRRVTGTQMIK